MFGKRCGSGGLCSPAFGLALGIVSGLGMMLFAWAGMFWGYGLPVTDFFASAYYGYSATWVGGFIGFVWGLVQGFISGLIFGWIYNCISSCCRCRRDESDV